MHKIDMCRLFTAKQVTIWVQTCRIASHCAENCTNCGKQLKRNSCLHSHLLVRHSSDTYR